VSNERVSQTNERSDVRVRLPDGRVFAAPRGTTIDEVFAAALPDRSDPPMAAVVDGKLRDMGWSVDRDSDIRPVLCSDSLGNRIYARALSFLLVAVVFELCSSARVHIAYSVPYGGYFCRILGRAPLTEEELRAIEKRMRELVAEKHPIHHERRPLAEMKTLLEARGEGSTVRLLEDRGFEWAHVHSLDGYAGVFHGIMPSTVGDLRVWALDPLSDGFVLRFPLARDPRELQPRRAFDELRNVFSEYGQWLSLLGLHDVAFLNRAIREGAIEEVILVSEALHERKTIEIATSIARRHREGVRLVLIAGPSASGKTTFAKRLSIQLLVQGLRPFPLSIDDYFHPRDWLYRKLGDAMDFDALSALDVDLLREHLGKLTRGESVTLPRFDFGSGQRVEGATVQLEPGQVLVVEGIHALNPALLDEKVAGVSFRVFVSALTQLNLDIHNRISTTDTRLLRRIVRDAYTRGHSARETIAMWPGVRRGEVENIFPYQEHADATFNSALVYELSALKPLVEPLLWQIRDLDVRVEADRLLTLLRWFMPCGTESIPDTSILREFVGGSNLADFTPLEAPRENE
jgi:uridine kinase